MRKPTKTLLLVILSALSTGVMIGLAIADSGWWLMGMVWCLAIFAMWMSDEITRAKFIQEIEINE